MKFKKILAGVVATVMITAAEPLSITVSAEEYDVGDTFYAKFDPSTGKVEYVSDDINDMAREDTTPENNGFYRCTVLDDGSIGVRTDCMGHAYVHGTLGREYSITIPSEINGYTVTEISGYCWGGYISITIPDTVKKLDESAFADNYFLEEIIFSENSQLEVIDRWAFQNCRSLRSVTIPATVKELGYGAFLNTVGQELAVPGDFDFTDVYSLTTVEFAEGSQLETIGEWAFQAQYALTNIEIPDSVTKICDGAFNLCTSLTEINIPNGVTEMGNYAFYKCTSLAKITIPASVTAIGEEAFTDCSDDLTIYGYADSYAETYATKNGINFVALEEEPSTPTEPSTPEEPSKVDTIEDKDTDIKLTAADGVLPENAVLNVKVDEENSSDTAVAFDITVTVDGKPADINGTVTVTIPVPEELKGKDKYYVYYKAEDGTLTDMNATYADGYITFTTTHFSTYIVSTAAMSADGNPDTGVTLLLIPAIAAAAGMVITKKRR